MALTSTPRWDSTSLLSCVTDASVDATREGGEAAAAVGGRAQRYQALMEAVQLLEREAPALAEEFRANRALTTDPQPAESVAAASMLDDPQPAESVAAASMLDGQDGREPGAVQPSWQEGKAARAQV